MNMEIQDLVRRFIEDDQEAFTELVRRYKKRVYSVAYRMMGNHLDADEVTQEAFVRIYDKRAEIRSASLFSSLLMRIATNYAIDLIRKRKKRFVSIDDDPAVVTNLMAELADYESTPDRILENAELMEDVEKAVRTLPPRQRMAIILHDIEGYAKTEVAEMMCCPQATVRSNLHIARLKLRKLLGKR